MNGPLRRSIDIFCNGFCQIVVERYIVYANRLCMGFGYTFGATPAVESASLRLKLIIFSGRRRNQGSSLKLGAAYPLVILFD